MNRVVVLVHNGDVFLPQYYFPLYFRCQDLVVLAMDPLIIAIVGADGCIFVTAALPGMKSKNCLYLYYRTLYIISRAQMKRQSIFYNFYYIPFQLHIGELDINLIEYLTCRNCSIIACFKDKLAIGTAFGRIYVFQFSYRIDNVEQSGTRTSSSRLVFDLVELFNFDFADDAFSTSCRVTSLLLAEEGLFVCLWGGSTSFFNDKFERRVVLEYDQKLEDHLYSGTFIARNGPFFTISSKPKTVTVVFKRGEEFVILGEWSTLDDIKGLAQSGRKTIVWERKKGFVIFDVNEFAQT